MWSLLALPTPTKDFRPGHHAGSQVAIRIAEVALFADYTDKWFSLQNRCIFCVFQANRGESEPSARRARSASCVGGDGYTHFFHNDILKCSRRSRNRTKNWSSSTRVVKNSHACSSRAFWGSRASLHLAALVYSGIASAFLYPPYVGRYGRTKVAKIQVDLVEIVTAKLNIISAVWTDLFLWFFAIILEIRIKTPQIWLVYFYFCLWHTALQVGQMNKMLFCQSRRWSFPRLLKQNHGKWRNKTRCSLIGPPVSLK